jgi:solute carrier family 12 sodium/potassium/chloride transporter 2
MSHKYKRHGMFSGVFLPTFLAIIGAILYLRLGYIVGGAGVLGTIIIILISISVTICTALSLSSITTNIEIGPGGAYSIISKTLGIEAGGSVGIPLCFSQILSVAFYILAFSEGWQYLFPDHPIFFVSLAVFGLLFLLTFITTNLAIKTQYIVLSIIIASLFSVFLGGGLWFTQPPLVPAFGDFQTNSIWHYFAIFFPSVTGLMAGIGLSGELRNAKKIIPRGILLAILVTTTIYLACTIWFGFRATAEELLINTNLMIEYSFFPPLVLLGLLSATFSSALVTFVAAPRLLQILGRHTLIPSSKFFAKRKKGEPRNAILFSSIIIVVILPFGSLNILAPILTVVFLLTYAIINATVLLQQSMGLTIFRPTFKIPRIVSLYGAVSAVVLIFLINTIAGAGAIASISLIYFFLISKRITPRDEDLRSNLFALFSELISRKISKIQNVTDKIWKPKLIIPITATETLIRDFSLIRDITSPNGVANILGIELDKNMKSYEGYKKQKSVKADISELSELVEKYKDEEMFISYSTISVKDYIEGICISLGAVAGQLFPPNILFLPFAPVNLKSKEIHEIIESLKKNRLGLLFFDRSEEISLGAEKDVHIWLPENIIKHPFDLDKIFDLGMLVGYELSKNWHGRLHLWITVKKYTKTKAEKYLKKIILEARLPQTEIHTTLNSIVESIEKGPQGDIHIIPFSIKGLDLMIEIAEKITDRSLLFTYDPIREEILY